MSTEEHVNETPVSSAATEEAAAAAVTAEDTPVPFTDILHCGFNQDAACLTLGLRSGYRIYDCSPFAQRFSTEGGGMGHVEMLFCTSLVVLVGGGDQPAFSPRRLRLCDTRKEAALCELNFATKVLCVKLNRKRVVVCLERAMHIFDIATMKCLQTLDTAPNTNGVMAFSADESAATSTVLHCYLAIIATTNCHLAFPGGGSAASSSSLGEVIIYDALTLKVLNKVAACQSKVAAMSFCRQGTLLATASEQGTVVRVFTVPGAQQVCTLRRGSYPVAIRSLAFNLSATRLAVSSDSGTIHVFNITSNSSATKASEQHQQQHLQQQQQHGDDQSHSLADSHSKRDSSTKKKLLHMAGGSIKQLLLASAQPWLAVSCALHGAFCRSANSEQCTKAVAALLPLGKRVTDYVDSDRSFAHARLQSGAAPRACALVADTDGGESLLAVTDHGILLRFKVDVSKGGECRLSCADLLLEGTSSGTSDYSAALYSQQQAKAAA
eukprot:3000-Heterococcus_DN1.PRE.2